MDDDLTLTQYEIPAYVLIGGVIEVAAAVAVLVACLVLVRRGTAALLGLVGALLAGTATGLSTLDTLDLSRGGDGLLPTSDGTWQSLAYARAIGLAVMGLALVLALLRTRRARATRGALTG